MLVFDILVLIDFDNTISCILILFLFLSLFSLCYESINVFEVHPWQNPQAQSKVVKEWFLQVGTYVNRLTQNIKRQLLYKFFK